MRSIFARKLSWSNVCRSVSEVLAGLPEKEDLGGALTTAIRRRFKFSKCDSRPKMRSSFLYSRRPCFIILSANMTNFDLWVKNQHKEKRLMINSSSCFSSTGLSKSCVKLSEHEISKQNQSMCTQKYIFYGIFNLKKVVILELLIIHSI